MASLAVISRNALFGSINVRNFSFLCFIVQEKRGINPSHVQWQMRTLHVPLESAQSIVQAMYTAYLQKYHTWKGAILHRVKTWLDAIFEKRKFSKSCNIVKVMGFQMLLY